MHFFDFFKSGDGNSIPHHKVIQEINKTYDAIQQLSNDDLRAKTSEVYQIAEKSLAPIREEIRLTDEKLKNLDVSNASEQDELIKQIGKKEKELQNCIDKVFHDLIPIAFSILKSTCFRFAMGEQVKVTANDFDRKLAEFRDYVFITDFDAIYLNKWMAGGKTITWDMIPHDTQLSAGISLSLDSIVEMLNGEGKTLAALFPIFLNFLSGQRIHISTANPFLSQRDCEWMRPILEFHGINVASVDQYPSGSDERKNAYRADAVYATANELGFDYLRDNLVSNFDDKVQSPLDSIIIDEIDFVLLDDARTPLNISGPAENFEKLVNQYKLLREAATYLLEEQNKLIKSYFEYAIELFADSKTEKACYYLHLIKLGKPKDPDFYNYLNLTPNVLSSLNRYEKSIEYEDNLPTIESNLLYYFKNGSLQFTENGRNTVINSLNEPGFWIFPDLDVELNAINQSTLSTSDKIRERQGLLDHVEFIQERHKILSTLIRAFLLFTKDVDYILEDGKVVLVDEITGRPLHGRRYSEGLHQALEAKENVAIQGLTEIIAGITLKSYIQKYKRMSGMTATAKTDEKEYKEIYGKNVVVIPPFQKSIRMDADDLVFKSTREKIVAVCNEVRRLNRTGRPILIGTTTIEDSELLSRCFVEMGLNHVVLNAKQDEKEANIISKAGLPYAVTIASMMAGRGTDIKLTPESSNAGGLAVIGFERHNSRRLDMQLKGRAGRHGQPGSSQFFASLEDSILRKFGSDRIASLMETLGIEEGEVIQHSMITKSIERAQRKIEENDLSERSYLFQYDDDLNIIRDEIYKLRENAILGKNINRELIFMFDNVAQMVIKDTVNLEYEYFTSQVYDTFNLKTSIQEDEFKSPDKVAIKDKLTIEAFNNYRARASKIVENAFPVISNIFQTQSNQIKNVVIPFVFKNNQIQILSNLKEAYETTGHEIIIRLEGSIISRVIDTHWRKFLKNIERIKKDNSSLSKIERIDPLFLFKQNVNESYEELLEQIHSDIVMYLCFAEIPVNNK